MITGNVYLVNIHPGAYRRGQPAKVIGLIWFKGKLKDNYRLCYKVEYDNGEVDYEYVEGDHYNLMHFEQITKTVEDLTPIMDNTTEF